MIHFIARFGRPFVRKPVVAAILFLTQLGLAIAFFFSSAMVAPAATKNWNDGTDFWNVNGNWNPATVPVIGEPVNIAFSDGAARTVTLDVSTPSLGLLSIDLTGAGAAASTLSMPSNFNLTAAGLFVGGYNGSVLTAGRGAIDQMSGTVTASVSPGVILGYGAGSSGTYTLSSGTLNSNVGSVYVGFNGTGTFNQTAGTVTITNNFLDVGRFTTGDYNLSGGSLTVREEYIGDDGTAHFTQTGGTNTVTGATGLIIAYSPASHGSYYDISGGSLSLTTGDLLVGRSGVGALTISDGGHVSNANATLGSASGSSGVATVDGAGSQWISSSVLAVGASGDGSLSITNGGFVSSNLGRIGRDSGETGNVTVDGQDSKWQITSDLTVGSVSGTGTGTLTIQNQGTVYVGSSLSINSTSNVNLNGGTLRFNTISGINRLAYTAGTIQLAGNRDFQNDTTIATLFPSQTIPLGKKLVIEGTTAIQLNTEMVDGGELVSQGALSVGSTFAGYLKVLNAGKVTAVGSAQIDKDATGINVVSGAGSTWTIGTDLTIATGDLTIQNQGLVYVGGAVNITSGVTAYEINLNGGTLRFATYSNPNRITYTSGTIQIAGDHTIGTDSTIAGIYGSSPTIPTGKQLTVEGTATIAASSQLTLTGGTLAADSVVLSPASRVVTTQSSQVKGAIVALAGSTTDATAADLTLGDATKVNGFYSAGTLRVGQRTVTLTDANDAVLDAAALATLGSGANPGTLTSAHGLTLNFGGNITGFGTVDMPNTAATPFINNGHVTGTSAGQPLTLPGYVKGVGTFDNVNFTGTFSPGFSPAKLTLGSAVYGGTLDIEIGGLSPGSGYDQLNHILGAGTAQLGGALDVLLINGFTPAAGNSFQIITATGGISGAFTSFSLPALAAPLAWNTNQLYSSGVLSVIDSNFLPGDINRDTHVDVADVSAMMTALSDLSKYQATPAPGKGPLTNQQLLDIADLHTDNFVNNLDVQGLIVYLANNAGALPAAGGDSVTAVPEPSSLILLAIAFAAAPAILRARRP